MVVYSLLIPVAVLESKYPFRFFSAVTVVRNNDDIVVFDTGFPEGSELLKGLKTFGFDPDSITWVFNSHIHIDHFGGNHLFKKAKKVVSRRDYLFQKRWGEALLKTRDKLSYIEKSFPHLPKRDVEKLIDFLLVVQKSHFREHYLGDPDTFLWTEDHPPVPEWIRIFSTPGHTPYHLSFLVQGREKKGHHYWGQGAESEILLRRRKQLHRGRHGQEAGEIQRTANKTLCRGGEREYHISISRPPFLLPYREVCAEESLRNLMIL